MPRKTFTNHEKLSFLAIVKERRAKGEALRSIARSLKVEAKQLRQWANASAQLSESRSTAKSTNTGPKSVLLASIRDELLSWIQFLWTKAFPDRPGISINAIVVTPPRQPNDFDCGIFTILNATCIVTGHSPTNCSDWYTSDQGSAHRAVARQQFLDFINR